MTEVEQADEGGVLMAWRGRVGWVGWPLPAARESGPVRYSGATHHASSPASAQWATADGGSIETAACHAQFHASIILRNGLDARCASRVRGRSQQRVRIASHASHASHRDLDIAPPPPTPAAPWLA